MKNIKIMFLVFGCLIALAVSPVYSQKSWEKPSQKWSKDDAVKVLNNSPWAQTYIPSSANFADTEREIGQTANSGGSNPGSTRRIIGLPPVVIRVFSANPVRQAIIRLQQIEAGYDKMEEKKRAAFDESLKNILDCPLCKPFIVIGIAKIVDTTQGVEDGMFQTTKAEELIGNVKLVNDKGEVRELLHITAPEGANDMAMLFFARKDEKGNDFLTPDTKSFKLSFGGGFLNGKSPYARLLQNNFDFNSTKMKIGDKIEY